MASSKENTKQNKGFNLWELFWTLFWFGMLVLVLLKFLVFQHVTVVGKSMLPNYDDGQLLLVNQVDKKFDRGQVVAVYSEPEIARDANYFTRFSARFFLKRIVGLPSESIEIIGGDVIIYNQQYPNGSLIIEEYIPNFIKEGEDTRGYFLAKTKIPADSYFVMGDNRGNSTDSRNTALGTVKDYAMFGQETLRIWPISTVEKFEKPNYSFQEVTSSIETKREVFSQK